MIVGAAGSCVTFGKEGPVGFASVKQGALLPCGDDLPPISQTPV